MSVEQPSRRRRSGVVAGAIVLAAAISLPAQQMVTETRDPAQPQDETFAKAVAQWTTQPYYSSPLVDHLPKVEGIPSPKDVLGYHIGAPAKLTYYADILKYYRALAAATPRVKVETIGKSDEDRELVVVWVSSDENMKSLQVNRDNLAKIADPRGLSPERIRQLIETTKPHYHLMGGLHSGETGPSEMLMELVYRLATETSPLIRQIRENVIVSVTPVADADGRDRHIDWFYRGLEIAEQAPPEPDAPPAGGGGRGAGGGGGVPYWGKYVFHDNNRDINLSQMSMRAITDWYFTAHPPIMHDLHESLSLMYTYSGAAPQNPNLDPILFAELPWFSNFELAQMTKWGMPGVYTYAFMDGWSPGYLGSVSYNHNGMMRMYETQSGREPGRGGEATDGGGTGGGRGGRGGAASPPTGRGGGQPREWYRGLPVPQGAAATFSRRNNTNYMQTGVLSGLQLTATFPNLVVENFYQKTKNSIESGKTQAPHGFVIPLQRDMTRVAELVNILRLQRIEVGRASAEIKTSDGTFPAGSYVIKRDQPYGRLAKNLLEKQSYPDPALRTYDDSGWTMGLAMQVEVREIKDKTILDVRTTTVDRVALNGKVTSAGTAGLAVAHLGSNNMIAFRYELRNVPMKIADKSFTAEGIEFPAGSFVIAAPADLAAARAAVSALGLTAASLSSLPTVAMHDARSAPGRDVLLVERHAGDRLGAVHVRQVRHPVRSHLQGACAEGQSPRGLRRHRDADAERRAPGRVPAARRASRAVHAGHEVQVPRHVRRVARHHRRDGRGRGGRVREVPRRGGHAHRDGRRRAVRDRARSGPYGRRLRRDLARLLRAASDRQRRDRAPRASGLLRLRGQDHADQVPGRAAADGWNT